MHTLLTLFCGLFALTTAAAGNPVLLAADRPAYRLFTAAGKPVEFGKMTKELATADVVLFGEQHNDPIAHWLELQVAKDLAQRKAGQLVLGLEMFERDVQPLVEQYNVGELADTAFEARSRPWPNYRTDYKPLLQLAQQQKLRVVGTNVPRRYASQVARGGLAALEALPAAEKAWLAPLPLRIDYELPGYKGMAQMFGGDAAHGAGVQYIIQAQALKDATMAYFIRQSRQPGQLLLHVNGSYHSDNHDGIVWYLRQAEPQLRIRTISTVTQEQLGKLDKENLQKADYVLVVPADMTKTY
ncbi:ChaN family lipoprotein [Hymenobacter busanensis]|uniref:ChaN family lipoprotein n=1 Tax=Hymenobacter busanensis TaxID=2607656 RepID=A0A7L4ZV76_9BACT|nr:ChaN family lipoprotein [Hymenobacter busanensis]KAA9332294.1 ChaN family lipoprotein [Hymenobacter busanensis]QHJ07369.1 iron-regulated protein [Hymenobacter busanensis]